MQVTLLMAIMVINQNHQDLVQVEHFIIIFFRPRLLQHLKLVVDLLVVIYAIGLKVVIYFLILLLLVLNTLGELDIKLYLVFIVIYFR